MTIQQLMEALSTSESTIRRDLAELDANGLLEKVHGGAIAKNVTFTRTDESVTDRKKLHAEAKLRIARHAASLIEPADFVYLDAGTTTELMIPFISAKATFVTNGFSHAKRLAEAGLVTYILGGEVKVPTEAVVGEEAILALSKYHFTKGFWGTNGISLANGFSTPDVKEAMIKQMAFNRTRERFVVSDASKFSQISCITFAEFSDATIITAELEGDLQVYRSYKNVREVQE